MARLKDASASAVQETDDILESQRSVSRWLKAQGVTPDERLTTLSNRTLKNLDQLKDLVEALKKIDTQALTGG